MPDKYSDKFAYPRIELAVSSVQSSFQTILPSCIEIDKCTYSSLPSLLDVLSGPRV